MNIKFLRNILTLLFIIFLSNSWTVNAQDEMSQADKENVLVLIGEFKRCTGFYSAYSEILTAWKKPSAAKLMKQNRNGWYLASAELLSWVHDWPKKRLTEEMESSEEIEKTRFLSLLELDMEKAAKVEFPKQMKKCEEFSDVQTQIVDEIMERVRKR